MALVSVTVVRSPPGKWQQKQDSKQVLSRRCFPAGETVCNCCHT